jgi:trigger factor
MKVTKEKTENSQAYLTIEMDPTELEESMEKSYRKLVQTKKVPGFRVGKTPRAIFEKYYSRKNLLEDALDDLVPEAYRKAVKEQELEPIANPQIEVTQTEPVVFKAVVPLKPTVKLGDYRQIRATPDSPRETGDKEIDEVIERLRHSNATWEPVTRGVKSGDLLTLDIASDVEGKPFINQKGAQFQATAGTTFPVAGFSEQLVDMKKDQEKEFDIQFPADDPRTEYAGKTVKFRVKVNETKEEKMPEVNDDFARQIGQEFTTTAALRDRIASQLKEQATEDVRLAFEDKVIEAAVEQCQIEFPEILTDSEIHNLIDQRFRTRQDFEAYMKATGKTEEQLHTELHEELESVAKSRVRRSLMLGKVADEEKIGVAPSEVDADIERMLKNSENNREALSKSLNAPEVRESIQQRLLTRKTVERLVEIAKGGESKKEESK